ncbi:MAG: hypothetical protein K2R98_03160 [Gemmataceae bacterium]|nr:hypothetical protein [Gemmataceae bacterium]
MYQVGSGSGRFLDPQRLHDAMSRAVQQALWEHKQLGFPIAVWQDGQVVWIPPDEIVVSGPPDPPAS